MDLSIVIVNMNAAEMLRRCLLSIERTRNTLPTEVILVDNASTDNSIEVTRSVCPRARILEQAQNVGYVRANNIGLAAATGRYVMFLNNDTEILPDCLAALVHFLDEHPQVGAVSGQILNPDSSDQGTARRFPTLANAFFGRRSILTHYFPNNRWSRRYLMGRHRETEESFEVEILSSACLVLRTALAQATGGMDEDFRLYWVDAEWCNRVRERGYQVWCVPAAKLIHYEGQGGSTHTFRQRCRSTIAFHQDAFQAYVKTRHLPVMHPLSLITAGALTVRACCLTVVQLVRPHRSTSSGGRN